VDEAISYPVITYWFTVCKIVIVVTIANILMPVVVVVGIGVVVVGIGVVVVGIGVVVVVVINALENKRR
jgi:hypothetical protein